jgi:nucleotide-binding universal stress UspA family protein
MTAEAATRTPPLQPPILSLRRIAAAVDPYPEGQDAAALAAALTAALSPATGAELMLLSVEPDLPLIIPGLDRRRIREETTAMLASTRAVWAPEARTGIESDLSVPRGLERMVRAQHRDLLVLGSSRHAPEGDVAIARRTRQLMHELECSLAIAPRGLSRRAPVRLQRIGVGFDGGSQSRLALSLAAGIATVSDARLIVRGVVDDRVPALGWPNVWMGAIKESWQEVMNTEVETMRELIGSAAGALGVEVEMDLRRGRPATSLRELSDSVDLLIIGSRRWGLLARLLLGGTGEALVHGAHCPLLIVPRSLAAG